MQGRFVRVARGAIAIPVLGLAVFHAVPSGAQAAPASSAAIAGVAAGAGSAGSVTSPSPSSSGPVAGGSVDAERKTLTLETCLALAERNHPNIWASRARLGYMRAQLAEAHAAPFSQFSAVAGFGPAPTLRGNSVYSPNSDVSFTSSLGLWWGVKVEGTVPLWTFGKITNLWDAAEAQIKVGEADVAKQQNLVKMDVRRAYYGLKVARDGIALIDEVIGHLDKALEHAKQELDEGNGDEIDQFKLATLRNELEARRAEARRYETIALTGLRFLTGLPDADVGMAPVRPIGRALLPVTQYLTAARLHRPDIHMVRAGIRARRAQVELARSKYFPDFGLQLGAAWQRAPEVADQLNPFVRDDANYFRYGFGFGLRWQLDFLPNLARVDQAEAQLEEMRQTERFALGGVAVEVETAYAQVVDALAREKAYGVAEKTARRWLVAVQQGIDVGTREDADLVDPARQWAMQRYNHLNAVLDLNMAWSNLALTTGWAGVLDTPPG